MKNQNEDSDDSNSDSSEENSRANSVNVIAPPKKQGGKPTAPYPKDEVNDVVAAAVTDDVFTGRKSIFSGDSELNELDRDVKRLYHSNAFDDYDVDNAIKRCDSVKALNYWLEFEPLSKTKRTDHVVGLPPKNMPVTLKDIDLSNLSMVYTYTFPQTFSRARRVKQQLYRNPSDDNYLRLLPNQTKEAAMKMLKPTTSKQRFKQKQRQKKKEKREQAFAEMMERQDFEHTKRQTELHKHLEEAGINIDDILGEGEKNNDEARKKMLAKILAEKIEKDKDGGKDKIKKLEKELQNKIKKEKQQKKAEEKKKKALEKKEKDEAELEAKKIFPDGDPKVIDGKSGLVFPSGEQSELSIMNQKDEDDETISEQNVMHRDHVVDSYVSSEQILADETKTGVDAEIQTDVEPNLPPWPQPQPQPEPYTPIPIPQPYGDHYAPPQYYDYGQQTTAPHYAQTQTGGPPPNVYQPPQPYQPQYPGPGPSFIPNQQMPSFPQAPCPAPNVCNTVVYLPSSQQQQQPTSMFPWNCIYPMMTTILPYFPCIPRPKAAVTNSKKSKKHCSKSLRKSKSEGAESSTRKSRKSTQSDKTSKSGNTLDTETETKSSSYLSKSTKSKSSRFKSKPGSKKMERQMEIELPPLDGTMDLTVIIEPEEESC